MSHTNPVIEFSFADKESQEENTEKKETTCKRKISPNLYINCQNVRDWTPTFPRVSTQHLLSLRWNVVENCSLPLAQALLMVSLETEPSNNLLVSTFCLGNGDNSLAPVAVQLIVVEPLEEVSFQSIITSWEEGDQTK